MDIPSNQNWRRLVSAYFVSSMGDEFTRIALMAKAYGLDGDVRQLSLVVLAQAIPSILVAPLAGALCDRGGKRGILIAADFLRVVSLVAIALTSSFAGILALAAVTSALTVMFRPVEAALEADYLPEGEVLNANGLRYSVRQVLSILGPSLVGLTLAAWGATTALLIDAGSYLLSGLILLRLPGTQARPRAATGPRRSLRQDLVEGMRYLGGDSHLRVLLGIQALVILLLGMQGPLFFDFVATRLDGGGAEYGVLMVGLGVGSVVGARWVSRTSRGMQARLILQVLVLDGLALGAFAVSHSLWACTLWMTVMGGISAVFAVVVRSYLQTTTEASIRGRVLGLFEGINGPLTIVSLSLSLLLMTWMSAPFLLGMAGASEVIAAGVALWLFRGLAAATNVKEVPA